jgi:hypothetical protein
MSGVASKITGMRERWVRRAAAAAVVVAAPYLVAGCGDDETSPPEAGEPQIIGPGLGLSEWSDDGEGDRRVLRVSDDQADADEPGDRTVTALVEICAPARRAAEPAGSDWSLVLDTGGSAEAVGPPQPTTDGAPALPASGRIAPRQCAFADVAFRVPAGAVTVGAVFHPADAGDVRWSWSPDDTRVGAS